jgi:hypothetical protein
MTTLQNAVRFLLRLVMMAVVPSTVVVVSTSSGAPAARGTTGEAVPPAVAPTPGEPVDLAQFGELIAGEGFIGVEWDEPRNVREVRWASGRRGRQLRMEWWQRVAVMAAAGGCAMIRGTGGRCRRGIESARRDHSCSSGAADEGRMGSRAASAWQTACVSPHVEGRVVAEDSHADTASAFSDSLQESSLRSPHRARQQVVGHGGPTACCSRLSSSVPSGRWSIWRGARGQALCSSEGRCAATAISNRTILPA